MFNPIHVQSTGAFAVSSGPSTTAALAGEPVGRTKGGGLPRNAVAIDSCNLHVDIWRFPESWG